MSCYTLLCCGTVDVCQQFGLAYGLILNPEDVAIHNPETSALTHQTTTRRHNTEVKVKDHPRTGHEGPEGE